MGEYGHFAGLYVVALMFLLCPLEAKDSEKRTISAQCVSVLLGSFCNGSYTAILIFSSDILP